MLKSVSPLDGRYHQATAVLSEYFSEYALIKYRVIIEVEYLKALAHLPLPQLKDVGKTFFTSLDEIISKFSVSDAENIKNIEKTTNHDVKAVEYLIKDKLESAGFGQLKEFVHFGLTSQDINNTAFPMMIKSGMEDIMQPALYEVLEQIKDKAMKYQGLPMLARTHGQPASPTTLGKELMVFIERLEDEIQIMNAIRIKCKFGGASGNFNAHKVSYPDIDWIKFGNEFTQKLGLRRSQYTTQIAHYDDHAAIFQSWCRINTILIDFCRDIWTYISMEYFKQKTKEGEIGSSAMPHKVNPIDFENAEGNLGIANAIFQHLAEKLPISRLQRDLTDSTVLRNVGVPFGHSIIAYKSIIKGIGKLLVNNTAMDQDLENNWAVVAEAIQNILRREQYPEPYEALKSLTRGKGGITKESMHEFILGLKLSKDIEDELLAITPQNYVGYY
ncbi:MAG: adenylosuccinate lyase [Saprospiraceae bacterium]|nr:adenylosuccinate lyase [Saprospiraceae bacterium]